MQFVPPPSPTPGPGRIARPSDAAVIETLRKLGFFTTRLGDQERYNSDFELASLSKDHLTLEEFVTDLKQRGHSNAIRHAAFRAFDSDGRGYISRCEYLLCRAAFDFVPERDRGTEVVVYRLQIIFNIYDKNGDGVLQMSELTDLIADLAAGASHVQRLMANLGIDETASVTLDKFLAGVAGGHFDKHFLHTRDIFDVHSNVFQKSGRVILDPRAVVSGFLPRPPLLADKFRRPNEAASVIVGSTPGTLNQGLFWSCIDPSLTTNSDWRGPLTPPRDSIAYKAASSVVRNALVMMREHLHKSSSGSHDVDADIADSKWLVRGLALTPLLGSSDQIEQLNTLKVLCEDCQRVVSQQPMMVEVPTPSKIFGDIHGQFRDLLLMFREFGFPSHHSGDIETVSYVFNGDFVDRGAHQIETVALLFALKICYPSRVFLVRGNHEFVGMNKRMGSCGFLAMCSTVYGSYGQAIFDMFHESFAYLPLSARVGKSILVLHGGLGDGQFTLRDLQEVPRPLWNDDINAVVMNVLWSDPSDSDAVMSSGVHANEARDVSGVIKRFDQNITAGFCARENIQLVVRSHQFVPEGYRIMHGGHLVTVFSARDYHDSETNSGALLLVARDHEENLRVRPKVYKHRNEDEYSSFSIFGQSSDSQSSVLFNPGSNSCK